MSFIQTSVASLALGLRLAVAWRLDVVTRLLSGGVVLVLTGALWTAVTDGRPEVAGRSGPELVSYAVLAWVVARISATPIDQELGQRTRTGAVVHDLLRPGGLLLVLTGNATEPEISPAVLTKAELTDAFTADGMFALVDLKQGRFDSTPDYDKLSHLPLAWIALFQRTSQKAIERAVSL